MKIRLSVFALLILNFSMYSTSSIIVLYGLGSAGKTSICTQLKDLCKNNNLLFISSDQHFFWPQLVQIANELGFITNQMLFEQKQRTEACDCQLSPLAFEYGCQACFSQNLKNIIATNIYSLYPHCNWPLTKEKLAEKIKLIAQSSRYKYIIVDTVLGRKEEGDFEKFHVNLEGLNISYVFVHCSPLKLAEHIINRNSLLDPVEKRDLILSLLLGFFPSYKIVDTGDSLASNNHLILTQQDIVTLLKIVKQNLNNNLHQSEADKIIIKQQIIDLEKLYNETLFSQSTSDCVKLIPLFYYDMIINTGDLSSQEAAQLIYTKYVNID